MRRFAGLLAASLLLAPLGVASRALGLVGRWQGAAMRLAATTQALWSWCMLRGMGIRLDLPPVGREIAPGPFLVVANHLSYVDIAVLGFLFPGRFVAKSEIARWPVVGWLARLGGTIFLRQARRRELVRVGEEIGRTLAAGVGVVLFPEGRASRGARIERLHPGLLESAARQELACLAVALGYETPGEPWAPAASVCWWGGMGFWPHLWNLLGMKEVSARVRWTLEPIRASDRKELAERLRVELEERFAPVRQGPIAPDFPWRRLFVEI